MAFTVWSSQKVPASESGFRLEGWFNGTCGITCCYPFPVYKATLAGLHYLGSSRGWLMGSHRTFKPPVQAKSRSGLSRKLGHLFFGNTYQLPAYQAYLHGSWHFAGWLAGLVGWPVGWLTARLIFGMFSDCPRSICLLICCDGGKLTAMVESSLHYTCQPTNGAHVVPLV